MHAAQVALLLIENKGNCLNVPSCSYCICDRTYCQRELAKVHLNNRALKEYEKAILRKAEAYIAEHTQDCLELLL